MSSEGSKPRSLARMENVVYFCRGKHQQKNNYACRVAFGGFEAVAQIICLVFVLQSGDAFGHRAATSQCHKLRSIV